LRRHGAKLVASAVITAIFVFALKNWGLKFIPEGSNFGTVKERWWTIPAYLTANIAFSYFRAVRWRFLLRSFAEIPKTRLLAVSWIGFAAILLMPFRIGEFVRPYMLRTAPRVDEHGRKVGGISMSAATGTIVAERIVDGLYLSIVLAIALITVPTVHPLPKTVVGMPVSVEQVRGFGFTMLGIFLVGFAVICVYYAARDFARRATLAVFGLISRKLGEKLATMAENLADGLRFLGRPRDALPFLWETTLYWLFNAISMWVLAYGCGVVHANGTGPTFGEACALMGMLGVAILIPGPPGLLGPFQAGIYAGMTMYYPTEVVTGQGAAYVFLLYILQFIWTIASGGAFLIGGGKTALRQLEEAEGILPSSTDDPKDEKLAGAPSSP
jgi:uncharacterized protein (TIRG00374 family)